jgi:hypothetical protein
VNAQFVDLTPKAIPYALRACDELLVAVAKGKATADSEKLQAGEVYVVFGAGEVKLQGSGLAVVAMVQRESCDENSQRSRRTVVKGGAAPDLAFAGGKMHAHLDVEREVSPDVYLGRLSGSAPVAEHTHPDSTEIICAIEAAGTFTLDGKDQRLGPRHIVSVPPATKHAWKPDPGSTLVAIQLYSPPGPEQRFKALAAAAADAGASKDGGK